MKVSQIINADLDELLKEMAPMRLKKSLDKDIYQMTVSDASLKERFTLVDTVTAAGGTIRCYLRKSLTAVIAVTDNPVAKEGENPNLIVCSLTFKDKSPLPKSLQVELVVTSERFRAGGIASILYKTLALHGYVIVSDFTQSDDGSKLWKRIASGKGEHLVVRVYDAKAHEFLKDKDDKELQYAPKDVPDHDIWSEESDRGKILTLLVLSKK